jgi:hypothetical protein
MAVKMEDIVAIIDQALNTPIKVLNIESKFQYAMPNSGSKATGKDYLSIFTDCPLIALSKTTKILNFVHIAPLLTVSFRKYRF